MELFLLFILHHLYLPILYSSSSSSAAAAAAAAAAASFYPSLYPLSLPPLLLAPPAPPMQLLQVSEPHPPSSALLPTAPSPQSPPLHTPQPLAPSLSRSASQPHTSTVVIAISALKCQTDLRSIGMHSHLPLQRYACFPTSFSLMLQVNESSATSGTESIAESATSYAHTTPPYSTSRRATTYPSKRLQHIRPSRLRHHNQ
ncbi:uncharacterized protein MONOS_6241 [Monocercomonoides exilis]|uniref:uncharacterized protein n=1 Tax=Monocercomonoides exilis TaxID=2049356 RepID=UPI0035596A9F|nr:hypothetical protein MONOS_6241 [Monocercomonoides exilis]|eukprot:MONOS_6241.1-p1 / transcript=MONOS_6241.1 / gene=MONOS_6241 / organism=Monocercomonoides_exilis_PA203 / gene_product=unspecified product / transcript_product=unspecified product / location=Mono_scaffold00194:11031-11633(-) / protein_length=201 / sequence_SO=supercontig / SO=protein_coding / is_pseudo=false